jgi:HNH endonuclease
MTYIPNDLRAFVERRANGKCEYCLIHEDYTVKRHEVDHIRATKHGGSTVDSNLCFSCYDCNRYKGSDLTSIGPNTNEITPLFHPRQDKWVDHFVLNGAVIEPRTPKGSATVQLLRLNHPNRVIERSLLIAENLYP